MADLNKTVAIVFDATDLTSDSLAKIQTGLQGLVKDTDDTGASAAKAGEELKKMGDSDESIFSLANSMKALAGSIVVQAFIDANVASEKLLLTFTALKGSTEAAAEELEYIKGVANTLGVNANDLAEAWGKFSAATAGSSLSGAEAQEIFEAFAGTLSILGASTEDISGAMTQLSQGVSKGKFELEDLKSIAERVPGFFDLMAQSLDVTTAELFKMVSQGEITGDTMVAVAEKLKEKYGDVAYVDTFSAAWARLKNALADFATEAGDSGAMDNLKNTVNVAAAALDALNDQLQSVQQQGKGGIGIDNDELMQLTGPAGGITSLIKGIVDLGAVWIKAKEGAQDAGEVIERFLLSIDGADAEGLKQIQAALEEMYQAGNLGAEEYKVLQDAILLKAQGVWPGVAEEIEKATGKTLDLKAASKEVDAALKALGLDPKQIYEPAEEAAAKVQAAIADLVNNPATKPEEMFTGLIAAIDQLARDQLPALEAAAQGALDEGKLSAEQYGIVMDAIASKAAGNWPEAYDKTSEAAKRQADALAKTEAEARKAQDSAQKYALELEKIASNEKIKAIEAKVQLDIAEVQANAQIATAILDSLSQTYTADVGLIGDLMSSITNGYSLADRTRIALVNDANARANELHRAQMALIAAQVEYMAAKTSAIASGNGVVTINAQGLQPHLEAFMWEILSQIQVKMASESGSLLTGGCSL